MVLNACYSEVQAAEINKHINYVIGIKQEITDKAAIALIPQAILQFLTIIL